MQYCFAMIKTQNDSNKTEQKLLRKYSTGDIMTAQGRGKMNKKLVRYFDIMARIIRSVNKMNICGENLASIIEDTNGSNYICLLQNVPQIIDDSRKFRVLDLTDLDDKFWNGAESIIKNGEYSAFFALILYG